MPGTWTHLAARFADVLMASDLSGAEADWVRDRLTDPEADIFFAQPRADRRHGYETARALPADPEQWMVTAALLHDAGKRHASLGPFGRVIATIAIKSNLPLWSRARLYRDHGVLVAAELTAAGTKPAAVAFARHHHGSRPGVILERQWAVLQSVDRAVVRIRSPRRETG